MYVLVLQMLSCLVLEFEQLIKNVSIIDLKRSREKKSAFVETTGSMSITRSPELETTSASRLLSILLTGFWGFF